MIKSNENVGVSGESYVRSGFCDVCIHVTFAFNLSRIILLQAGIQLLLPSVTNYVRARSHVTSASSKIGPVVTIAHVDT